ncbi:hypothetical protein E2C01_029632 [Portunus trituberculatus]|uniref:Uncharacterized protein n=1 Tax=Portunus trituberculatus TaxID=210409 RepID=A0A5B7EV37_PORTR|nr:hypothetical protein [Portunus trituberculatus]
MDPRRSSHSGEVSLGGLREEDAPLYLRSNGRGWLLSRCWRPEGAETRGSCCGGVPGQTPNFMAQVQYPTNRDTSPYVRQWEGWEGWLGVPEWVGVSGCLWVSQGIVWLFSVATALSLPRP